MNPNAETARNITADLLAAYYVSPRPETQIDTRFDLREAIAAALHEAVESGLATAQAELAKVRAENEVLTENLARSGRCYAENMDTLGKVQAELAALREALVGVIKEADRETDAFIFARKVLARSETAP